VFARKLTARAAALVCGVDQIHADLIGIRAAPLAFAPNAPLVATKAYPFRRLRSAVCCLNGSRIRGELFDALYRPVYGGPPEWTTSYRIHSAGLQVSLTYNRRRLRAGLETQTGGWRAWRGSEGGEPASRHSPPCYEARRGMASSGFGRSSGFLTPLRSRSSWRGPLRQQALSTSADRF
jgi:hypothetical protein